MAYEAFCRGTHVQVQSILQLLRIGQISDNAFIEARIKSLRDCPKIMLGGLPEGTIEAVRRLRDEKRVFHVPMSVTLADPSTNKRIASLTLTDYPTTRLMWYVQRGGNAESTWSRVVARPATRN